MRDHGVHEAVMVDQVINNLIADKKGNYVDCTFGLGGHAFAILKKLDSEAKLTGIDSCLLYTSPSPRDLSTSRMPSSA